ncbi:MAG TPA: hypothetical protein DD490_05870, partial [Acidobacteria bacterium]|nr:hypothetical protein [Acidobacteriota bacterium]
MPAPSASSGRCLWFLTRFPSWWIGFAEGLPLGGGVRMLDSVDQIELSRRQRPREGRSGEVAAALRALAFAASEEDAEVAYHRVLFAVGNNHGGSYFPIVLDAIPFLGEVLGGGTRFGRARALDVLIDLISSFEPDPEILVQEGLRPDELPGMLHASVDRLRPILQVLATDSAVPELQRLARELIDSLDED